MSKRTKRSVAFKESSFSSKKIENANERYITLANMFCEKLGLSENDLRNFIISNEIPDNLKKYKIITAENFSRMQTSLNEAFKAGEEKEYNRHLSDEDKAFERGVKYGEGKERNKNKKILNDEKNILKASDKLFEKTNKNFNNINKNFSSYEPLFKEFDKMMTEFFKIF